MNVVASGLGRDRISASAAQPRVMVVDDPAFLRDGLAVLLSDSGLEVVAYVATGETGLGVADERGADVDVKVPQCVRGMVRLEAGAGHEIAVRAVRDRMM